MIVPPTRYDLGALRDERKAGASAKFSRYYENRQRLYLPRDNKTERRSQSIEIPSHLVSSRQQLAKHATAKS